MAATNPFHHRCLALFSERLGHGRRWKTVCATALGIGRATLYRYLEAGDSVPPDVVAKLVSLEQERWPLPLDETMVRHLARAVLDIQRRIDDEGSLRSGLPVTAQRAFDLGAARNFAERSGTWPVDLPSLAAAAQKPLYEWVADLSWDAEGEFTAARLIVDGTATVECARLASAGGDPEAETIENDGYKRLVAVSQASGDPDALYEAWRRFVVGYPVLSGFRAPLTKIPNLELLGSELSVLVEHFYHPVPEAMAVRGQVPLCRVSGTIARLASSGSREFVTEYRAPDAIELARSRQLDFLPFRPGLMYLRRPFRMFWCLPGLTELKLERALVQAGWSCKLWPRLDRIDLEAISPDGSVSVAVDVKDYVSPGTLAVRFAGFKEYSATHRCFVVVPDYLERLQPDYLRRFHALRVSMGKRPVELATASQFLTELGVA